MKRALLVLVLALAACDPPAATTLKKAAPLTELPSAKELAGRYDDHSTRSSLKKTLVLREDGTFTLTTAEYSDPPRVLNGTWTSRKVEASGLLELKCTPFFMPDGRTHVDSLAMPIQTCDGTLCMTHSEMGVFVKAP